jgi:hypothetical protein
LQLVQLRSCNRRVCAFAIQNAPGCILVSPYIYIYSNRLARYILRTTLRTPSVWKYLSRWFFHNFDHSSYSKNYFSTRATSEFLYQSNEITRSTGYTKKSNRFGEKVKPTFWKQSLSLKYKPTRNNDWQSRGPTHLPGSITTGISVFA